MEGVLAVLRPKPGVTGLEYRARCYDILLLDSKTPPGDKVRPAKYLPMFFLKVVDEEPREIVLSQLYKITGGDHGPGIKGERAVSINWSHLTDYDYRRGSLSRFSLFCVPVNPLDKLNRRFVEQAQTSPGFYSLDYVIEVLNNGSVNFPTPTKSLLLLLESWLRAKHFQQSAVESLFCSRAEYRIHLTVHNPAFIPSRIAMEEEVANLPPEIQLTANEALAKMMSIEKCDIVVMNSLFGTGLPYKTKTNKHVENPHWPMVPDYNKITIPDPLNTAVQPGWREKYPLHSSAAEGDITRINELIGKGLQHDKKDSISWAPIHYAAWYEQSVAVSALLNAGCSPNLADREAMTPLHMAAKKGNLQVAKVLLRNRGIDVNARDKEGQTALDICGTFSGRTWKHEEVATLIRHSYDSPYFEILEVFLMDGESHKLTCDEETEVHQLNKQMMDELGMPYEPYSDIFTIWICSKSLELQLKPEHKPTTHMNNWQARTIRMLTDANPVTETPMLKWRRNAKMSIQTEKQLLHPRAIDLLFHEAHHNYISALYPCSDQDAINFAAMLLRLKHGNLESSQAKAFLSKEKNLHDLLPSPLLSSKGHGHWSSKIVKEFNNKYHGKDLTPATLKRQFLSQCQNLTVYGSAFFTGSLIKDSSRGSRPVRCHIGVNDVGIHIIDEETKKRLSTYRYSEIEWKHVQEYSMLEVRVHVSWPDKKLGHNSPAIVMKLRSKQAGLINYLMRKLAEMHELMSLYTRDI
ncbi:krev interaction trapped protein 1-like isoform X2 [Gigantopelta aegis]|uniref:krev interaction trapped protein 1-like isoform X2 n=1 Tax=Gigantopelta aegis TaxID=1735272 RepID=UPI001B88AED7|nr:krev interaction trapped protein 1-like isoform X2 [Gigantopelta aegis]